MSERLLDVKSVWFGIEEDERGKMRKLLEDFRDMVNFCIGKAIGLNITSYYKLRKAIYDDFKERFDCATHYCHSACRVATPVLETPLSCSARNLSREARAASLKRLLRKGRRSTIG